MGHDRMLSGHLAHPLRSEGDVIMLLKKSIFVVLLVSGSAAITALPATSEARAAGEISIQIAPPPLPYEALPAPRRGHVWTAGYWNWHRHRHVWVPGKWVRERRGYAYHPHRWEQRGPNWISSPGRWDRDGDRVSDQRDRHPNNLYRR